MGGNGVEVAQENYGGWKKPWKNKGKGKLRWKEQILRKGRLREEKGEI